MKTAVSCRVWQKNLPKERLALWEEGVWSLTGKYGAFDEPSVRSMWNRVAILRDIDRRNRDCRDGDRGTRVCV